LINWTLTGNQRRVAIEVGVTYGADHEQVEKVLIEAAASHPKVLTTPPPFVIFEGFGDSALQFRLYFWVARFLDGFYTQSEVTGEVKNRLAEAGIEIPYPYLNLKMIPPENNEQDS
jgi:small-conductance mechanosensitive channel